MCIIVAVPKGKEVEDEILAQCFSRNNDSAGYMHVVNDKLRIRKFLEFDPFLQSFRDSVNTKESSAVLHFRIATHGAVDLENAHPLPIDDDWALCHNGTLYTRNLAGIKGNGLSDTRVFVDTVLRHFVVDDLYNPGFASLLEEICSPGSKLAFLDIYDNITIINESRGTWEKGVWYSNHSFRPFYQGSRGGKTYSRANRQLPGSRKGTLKITDLKTGEKGKIVGNKVIWDNKKKKDTKGTIVTTGHIEPETSPAGEASDIIIRESHDVCPWCNVKIFLVPLIAEKEWNCPHCHKMMICPICKSVLDKQSFLTEKCSTCTCVIREI